MTIYKVDADVLYVHQILTNIQYSPSDEIIFRQKLSAKNNH